MSLPLSHVGLWASNPVSSGLPGDELLQRRPLFSHRHTLLGTPAMEGMRPPGAKYLVTEAGLILCDQKPDPSVEVEVMDRGRGGVGSQIWKVGRKYPFCMKPPAASMIPFPFLSKGKKCIGCKNSPENRLSGFLKELSWGSKQHARSVDEVVTDGISGA